MSPDHVNTNLDHANTNPDPTNTNPDHANTDPDLTNRDKDPNRARNGSPIRNCPSAPPSYSAIEGILFPHNQQWMAMHISISTNLTS